MALEQLGSPPLTGPELRRHQYDIAAHEAFTGLVDRVRKSSVTELPDLTDGITQQGVMGAEALRISETPGELVMLSPEFYSFLGRQALPDRIEFATNPLLRLGKEDSRKQVFFGRLDARWFHDNNSVSGTVAIKPISDSLVDQHHAMQEIGVYQHLVERGVPTLNVLGLAMLEHPQDKVAGFIMTEFTEMTTLDTLPWADMTKEETQSYINHALRVLALLHQNLVFHGDADFRNITLLEEIGKTRIVDVERSLSLQDRADRPDLIAQRMSGDITDVETSVQKFVIKNLPSDERPNNDVERFEYLHNHVYEPYFEQLLLTRSEHTELLKLAYKIMLQGKMDRMIG